MTACMPAPCMLSWTHSLASSISLSYCMSSSVGYQGVIQEFSLGGGGGGSSAKKQKQKKTHQPLVYIIISLSKCLGGKFSLQEGQLKG